MAEEKITMEDVVRSVETLQQNKRIVTGTVIDINKEKEMVLVDIGFKSEGTISLKEFSDREIKNGDVIEVFRGEATV